LTGGTWSCQLEVENELQDQSRGSYEGRRVPSHGICAFRSSSKHFHFSSFHIIKDLVSFILSRNGDGAFCPVRPNMPRRLIIRCLVFLPPEFIDSRLPPARGSPLYYTEQPITTLSDEHRLSSSNFPTGHLRA